MQISTVFVFLSLKSHVQQADYGKTPYDKNYHHKLRQPSFHSNLTFFGILFHPAGASCCFLMQRCLPNLFHVIRVTMTSAAFSETNMHFPPGFNRTY